MIHLPDEILRKSPAEMVRLTKKGGRVVNCDHDGDIWTIDHLNRELTRRIVQFNGDQGYAEGWTGQTSNLISNVLLSLNFTSLKAVFVSLAKLRLQLINSQSENLMSARS